LYLGGHRPGRPLPKAETYILHPPFAGGMSAQQRLAFSAVVVVALALTFHAELT